MRQNSFGKLPPVSALTLGGGGIGMVWGETTFDECVATVHAAVAAGINLIDLAPRYGDGKAEQVVGEAVALTPEHIAAQKDGRARCGTKSPCGPRTIPAASM
jgi:aryl-alcohol dehydrogenase-like predicted oxidoreductase